MEGRARGCLPFVGMIMVVLGQASNMAVTKMAMSDGINKYTLVFYCNALSSLVLLPFPFIISRRSGSCPPLTFSVLRKIFLLALVGVGTQISECIGIDYSSPVLATAMMNLIMDFFGNFPTMFKTLGIVFATGLGFIFLGEVLHLGSLLGAIAIVMVFYGVAWGKSEEEEKTMEGGGFGGSLASSSHKMPLLQDKASSV